MLLRFSLRLFADPSRTRFFLSRSDSDDKDSDNDGIAATKTFVVMNRATKTAEIG